MFDNKVNDMVEDLNQRLAQQGLTLEMYMQFTGLTIESVKETYKEQAEKQVKLRLALEKIAELESIVATEEDIEKEFEAIGAAYNMPVETVKQYIQPENLKLDVEVGKAADLVKAEAVVE